jgi:hypothetical protein
MFLTFEKLRKNKLFIEERSRKLSRGQYSREAGML